MSRSESPSAAVTDPLTPSPEINVPMKIDNDSSKLGPRSPTRRSARVPPVERSMNLGLSLNAEASSSTHPIHDAPGPSRGHHNRSHSSDRAGPSKVMPVRGTMRSRGVTSAEVVPDEEYAQTSTTVQSRVRNAAKSRLADLDADLNRSSRPNDRRSSRARINSTKISVPGIEPSSSHVIDTSVHAPDTDGKDLQAKASTSQISHQAELQDPDSVLSPTPSTKRKRRGSSGSNMSAASRDNHRTRRKQETSASYITEGVISHDLHDSNVKPLIGHGPEEEENAYAENVIDPTDDENQVDKAHEGIESESEDVSDHETPAFSQSKLPSLMSNQPSSMINGPGLGRHAEDQLRTQDLLDDEGNPFSMENSLEPIKKARSSPRRPPMEVSVEETLLETVQDDDLAEEADDIADAVPTTAMDEATIQRMAAIHDLVGQVEFHLACTRDAIYESRIRDLDLEVNIIENNTHPELVKFDREIDRLLALFLEQTQVKRDLQKHYLADYVKAESLRIQKQYQQDSLRIKEDLLNEAERKIKQIHRENRRLVFSHAQHRNAPPLLNFQPYRRPVNVPGVSGPLDFSMRRALDSHAPETQVAINADLAFFRSEGRFNGPTSSPYLSHRPAQAIERTKPSGEGNNHEAVGNETKVSAVSALPTTEKPAPFKPRHQSPLARSSVDLQNVSMVESAKHTPTSLHIKKFKPQFRGSSPPLKAAVKAQ